MTVSTGRESDKFMLRFPEGMRDRIRAEAEQNNRSMNAEIIARLEASLDGAKGGFTADQVNRIVDRTVETLIKHGWQKPDDK